MVGIHIIEHFISITKDKITCVFSNIYKNKKINPRGKNFIDYNGDIFYLNKSNQKLIISTNENSNHGPLINYFFSNGLIELNSLTGNINMQLKIKNYSKASSHVPSKYNF